MLTYQHLLDVGTAPDADTFRERLVSAANELGYGLAAGALIRGRLASGKASVWSFGNPPAAFVEASKSLDLGLRDPLLTRLLGQPGFATYDQTLYVQAGAADLWDNQAQFGYRNGMAFSIHEHSHAEVFFFGVDGPDAISADPERRLRHHADLQLLSMHAQAAAKRLYFPETAAAEALSRQELEAIKWASDGVSVWKVGDRMKVSDAEARRHAASAAKKLGATSRPMAVLRAIEGGLITR